MLLIESQYFINIYSLKILCNSSHIGILLCDPFKKMSFQNRCLIPTANGLVNLTVPIVGGRETRQVMGEVRIDNSQPWQTRHWRTITSAYNRSPFFEHYSSGLGAIFQTPSAYLHEWNQRILDWILQQLRCRPFIENITTSTSGIRQDLPLPKNYREERFTSLLPEYQQVFMERWGFAPNVSCMDLLFCTGPDARSQLQSH